MRYRIKIITYKNGRIRYKAYLKKWWGWTGLDDTGEPGFAYTLQTRDEAIKAIDKHYEGNHTIKSIDFEYFTTSKI